VHIRFAVKSLLSVSLRCITRRSVLASKDKEQGCLAPFSRMPFVLPEPPRKHTGGRLLMSMSHDSTKGTNKGRWTCEDSPGPLLRVFVHLSITMVSSCNTSFCRSSCSFKPTNLPGPRQSIFNVTSNWGLQPSASSLLAARRHGTVQSL
jgi:hypothetical protein